MAITAQKEKKVKSKLKAAQIYSVPETTLREQLASIKPQSETHTNSHKLTTIKEESLIKILLDADKQGFSIRPEFLRGIAQILLHKRTQDPTAVLSINQSYSFTRRHPELHIRYNQRITYQRAKQEDPKVIKQWFETVCEVIQEHGIYKDNIQNFDKTGFVIELSTTLKIITSVNAVRDLAELSRETTNRL